MNLSKTEASRFSSSEMHSLRGKGNHTGSAVGKTIFIESPKAISDAVYMPTPHEYERYLSARRNVIEKLRRIYGELRTQYDAAWIFLMQITLLDDYLFTELPHFYISQGKTALEATSLIREHFTSTLLKKEGGENILELVNDIDDLVFQLTNELKEAYPTLLPPQTILLTSSLFPSYLIASRETLVGIVSSSLNDNKHTRELATALSIPYISTEEELGYELSRKNALINSERGYLYINPDIFTLSDFTDVDKKRRNEKTEAEKISSKALVSKEGKPIPVYAELNKTSKLGLFSDNYCDGIAKFYTEYSSFESISAIDEEELFEEYRRAAEAVPTKPIMIRSIKSPRSVHLRSMVSENENESHGDLYVLYDETLRTQLRAVMRAAVYGPLQFVLQLHQTERYSDLAQCAQMMDEISAELYEEDREFTPVPFGTVIDTISSAIMCDKIIEECDFVIVDGEKLSLQLLCDTQKTLSYDSDNIYFDAFDSLITSIAKVVEKKKKRALLSLGKNEHVPELSLNILSQFSAISVSADKIYQFKKKFLEI